MRKHVLYIVLYLIFLIIFNTAFFLLGGTEHPNPIWISYGFVHFAYFMLVITPVLVRKGRNTTVFGFALFSISAVYFLIAFIVGVIFILIAPETIEAALLIQLIIAGLYGIILIMNMIANDRTADAEESRQHEIEYVKNASEQIKWLSDRVKDKNIKRKIDRVYDTLSSSPIKSHPSLSHMEIRVLELLNELEQAVSKGDKEYILSQVESLYLVINERNTRLKTLNQ